MTFIIIIIIIIMIGEKQSDQGQIHTSCFPNEHTGFKGEKNVWLDER